MTSVEANVDGADKVTVETSVGQEGPGQTIVEIVVPLAPVTVVW